MNDCIILAVVDDRCTKSMVLFEKRMMRGHFGAIELISIVAKWLFLCGGRDASMASFDLEVIRINSFMSWVGGKKSLRNEILARFPVYYERYIEVFGGGGWVLFYKPPMNDFEVYNDFNTNLATLYRCVRDNPQQLTDALTFSLNARADFDRIKLMFKEGAAMSDVERAANFYQLIRYSYASGCDSFGSQPHSMWNNFPLIYQASRRLQKVVIENKDCVKLIGQYDRPVSFFYCDPPYFETEDYYDDVGFGKKDHYRLAQALLNIKGKFLLSYNDCDFIRELYDHDGIYIESINRINNLAQRYDGGSQYAELLISNYDTSQLRKQSKQMTLFEYS